VCDDCPIHVDIVVIAEFSVGELRAVVGDDGVRHSKPVDDVSEERHDLLGYEISDGARRDPF
jgi:hypothetical protein